MIDRGCEEVWVASIGQSFFGGEDAFFCHNEKKSGRQNIRGRSDKCGVSFDVVRINIRRYRVYNTMFFRRGLMCDG